MDAIIVRFRTITVYRVNHSFYLVDNVFSFSNNLKVMQNHGSFKLPVGNKQKDPRGKNTCDMNKHG